MIRDRGKIKWQPAHFMPEQTKMLKDMYSDDRKLKRPQLDEQKYEEIGLIVMDSLHYTLPIKVTIWKDGYFKDHIGIINKVDPLMTYIILETNNNSFRILIDNITAVERI